MPTIDMDFDYPEPSNTYTGLTTTSAGKDYGESGGDDISEMLGGKGMEMQKKHRGITSPSWGKEGWISGLEGKKGMGQLHGGGWISQPGKSIGEGYTLQQVTNPRNDAYWSESMFRDKYYDPYLKEAILGPLSSMGGPQWGGAGGYQVSSTAAPGTDFKEITYQDPTSGDDITGIVASPAGETFDIQTSQLTGALDTAREDYEDLVDRLTWEEGHEVFDKAKESLDEAELQARISRSDAMVGKPEDYEAVRAVQAKSGMAYSAPAESVEAGFRDESISEMESPAQTVAKARKDFADEKIKSEETLDQALGLYEDAQRDYYAGMAELAGTRVEGGSAFDNVWNAVEGLQMAHTGMGEYPIALAKIASVDRTGAMRSAGLWEEGQETPGIKQMKQWMLSSTGPKKFAEQMQSVMQAAYHNVGEGDNTDG